MIQQGERTMAKWLMTVNIVLAGVAVLASGCHCPGMFCVDRGCAPCGFTEPGYGACGAEVACGADPGCGVDPGCATCTAYPSGGCANGACEDCRFNCPIYYPENPRPLPPPTCGVEPTCGAPACGFDACSGDDCFPADRWRGLNRPPQIICRSPWQTICGTFGRCTGCGDCYWSEWYNDPPDCCDPCNRCGDYVGPKCCGLNRKMGFRRALWGQRLGGRNGYPQTAFRAPNDGCIAANAPHVTSAYVEDDPVIRKYQRVDSPTDSIPFQPAGPGGSDSNEADDSTRTTLLNGPNPF